MRRKLLKEDIRKADDGAEFNVDISKESGFDWDSYNKDFMLGIRQFVLKDDMSSLPQARTKLNRLYWSGKAFQLLSMYVILKLTSVL